MEDYSWSIVHESQSTECWVAGHARFVGQLRQCRDQQLDSLAWLARAVVVLFSEPVCSDALIYELKVGDAAMLRGLGSGYPEISERHGGLGREGTDYWAGRWGLPPWQFGLVTLVGERGWSGLKAGH
jgi:hypothetical protein